jgi:uncharacterized protein YbbK (DUF523 family)
MRKRLKVAISACLLGLKYRYDGSSKFAKELVEALKDHVDFIPVCPEVECGLGVPREPIRLTVCPDERVRLMNFDGTKDHSEAMLDWAACKIESLIERDVAAYVFKAKSPSCALKSAKLFKDGVEFKDGAPGFFTALLRARLRTMPVFEETASPEEVKKALLIR